MGEYEDSENMYSACIYNLGKISFEEKAWDEAITYLTDLSYVPEEGTSVDELLLLAKANKAFSENNYSEVCELLDEYSEKESLDIYSKAAYSVFSDELKESSDVYDSEKAIKTIEKYVERTGDDETIQSDLYKLFETLINEGVYETFPFMDGLVKRMPDAVNSKELKNLLDTSYTERVYAFLTGKWERKGDSHLKGLVIEIARSGDTLLGIVRDTSKIDSGYRNLFNVDDIKWKNIMIFSKKEVSMEDLVKHYFISTGEVTDSYYISQIGKINYKKNKIMCHGSDQTLQGNDQEWVRYKE